MRVLGGGVWLKVSAYEGTRSAYGCPSNIASVGSVSGPFSVHTA